MARSLPSATSTATTRWSRNRPVRSASLIGRLVVSKVRVREVERCARLELDDAVTIAQMIDDGLFKRVTRPTGAQRHAFAPQPDLHGTVDVIAVQHVEERIGDLLNALAEIQFAQEADEYPVLVQIRQHQRGEGRRVRRLLPERLRFAYVTTDDLDLVAQVGHLVRLDDELLATGIVARHPGIRSSSEEMRCL